MFLLRLDENRHWYRYHPLFAEFLRAQSAPAEQQRQHQAASAWYEANGFEEEAIRHAFAARDFPSTVRLFRDFADNVPVARRTVQAPFLARRTARRPRP